MKNTRKRVRRIDAEERKRRKIQADLRALRAAKKKNRGKPYTDFKELVRRLGL